FFFLQIGAGRFYPACYFGRSCAHLAFARLLSTDPPRQRFDLLADNGCRLVRLLGGSRAELSRPGRYPGNSPPCLVAIFLEAPLNFLLGLLAHIRISLGSNRSACPSDRRFSRSHHR